MMYTGTSKDEMKDTVSLSRSVGAKRLENIWIDSYLKFYNFCDD